MTNVHLMFGNCKQGDCKSPGQPPGQIETHPLAGQIVWQDKAAGKLALDLHPASGEENLADFECGQFTIELRGSMLVPIRANKMSETVTLRYKAKRGHQSVEYYEEGEALVQDVIEFNFAAKGFIQAGLTVTSTLTNEEGLEFNTVA